MSNQHNPYEPTTLQGNWWEERFFHADTRKDMRQARSRPAEDEVENIPRLSRRVEHTGDVFRMDNDTDPSDHFKTVSMQNFVEHDLHKDSVTQRRMEASPEKLAEILGCSAGRCIPDHSLPLRPPEKQYKTTYQKSYKRHI